MVWVDDRHWVKFGIGERDKPWLRREVAVRREALGTKGGARPSRWVVAAAW